MKKHLITAGLAATLLASCDKPAPGFNIAGGKAQSEAASSGAKAEVAKPAPAAPKAPEKKPEMAAVPTPATAPTPVPAPEPAPAPAPPAPAPAPAAPPATGGPTMTIIPEMPKALFVGTPLPSANPPPNLDKSTQPVLEAVVPEGVTLLSKGKPVTGSDEAPIGDYTVVTDTEKNGEDGYFVDMAPGKQWVQVDLGESKEIWLMWLWHSHKQGYIYNDVVAQISDDPQFGTATTVFNNDFDNSSGFGVGADQSYIETNNGRRIPVSGVKGRYVRFYSRGRDLDDTNQYTEIEVYGK